MPRKRPIDRELLERLRALIADRWDCPRDAVIPTAKLAALGLVARDDRRELGVLCEEEFGGEISEQQLAKLVTVSDVLGVL